MSPYEAWSKASAVTCIRLPQDLDELDVVCCDVVSCKLTSRGIVLENCTFNSAALQAILRDAPIQRSTRTACTPTSTSVQVRFNGSLMDAIWVLDARAKTRLRVPNIDPAKARLSAYQIAVALKIQRQAADQGQRISVGQAIERSRDAARELQFAKTQAQRRRALKILGLSYEETSLLETLPPSCSKTLRGGGRRDHDIVEDVSSKSMEDGVHSSSVRRDYGDQIQRLRTVIRPQRGTARVDK